MTIKSKGWNFFPLKIFLTSLVFAATMLTAYNMKKVVADKYWYKTLGTAGFA